MRNAADCVAWIHGSARRIGRRAGCLERKKPLLSGNGSRDHAILPPGIRPFSVPGQVGKKLRLRCRHGEDLTPARFARLPQRLSSHTTAAEHREFWVPADNGFVSATRYSKKHMNQRLFRRGDWLHRRWLASAHEDSSALEWASPWPPKSLALALLPGLARGDGLPRHAASVPHL